MKNLNIKVNKNIIRPHHRSLNILQKGKLGINIIQSFNSKYKDDFNLYKKLPSLNNEEISNLIYKKIIDIKKILSEQIKKNESKKTNEKNNEIKINENKPVVETKMESDITLKNFNYNESEKESCKTVKLNLNENGSMDKQIFTIDNLPKDLQKSIKSKIENEQILKNKDNKLKIEHIYIEINNYKKNLNYIYNNSLFDNSKINTSNNLSNLNINSFKIDNRTFNGEISQNFNDYEKSNYNEYKKSNSYNQKNKEKKKKNINSPKTLKLNKIKNRKKTINLLLKNSENKSKIKKEGIDQNSTKLTLSPINSSNIFAKLNTSKNISPKNIYKRSSVNNQNILLKLNEEMDKNNNLSSDNLSATSADSFHIKSIYKNLNQASGGKYSKNKKLQNKIIKYIKEFDINKIKERKLKSRLTCTFDIHNIIKGNKEEEENQFKKLEKTIRTVKTKMSDLLLKKKKKSKIFSNNQINNKNKNDDSMIVHSPSPKRRRTRLGLKMASLNSDFDSFNNSNLQMISLNANPDDTLSKLNCSNNEMIKMSVREDNQMKSEKIINVSGSNIFFSDKKK